MAVGLDPVATQRDFSAGMFRGVRPDLIPENGMYDITNGLLDNDGAIYRRGGSSYMSTAPMNGFPMTMVWDGYLLGAVRRTVLATPSGFGLLNGDGSISSLGGSGLAAPGRPAVLNGVMYMPGGATYNGTALGTAAKIGPYYAVAGNRLFVGNGDRIDFSDISTSGGPTTTFNATDYHQVPEGVIVTGLEGLRNALVVFTTGGVWVYSNLGFDLTDASGNIQQREDRYSRDLVLWGDAGIASWEGGLVVPGLDDVWVMSIGVTSEAPAPFQRIGGAITALYRSYVQMGCTPGQACIYRSHYLLPIMLAGQVIDLLVCRLDRQGAPWTHFSGYGAQVSALTIRAGTAAPPLIGGLASAGHVLQLSYFDPSELTALGPDGQGPFFTVTTRDMPTGPLNKNTISRVRLGYDMKATAAAHGDLPAVHTEWGLFDWGTVDWGGVAVGTTFPEIVAKAYYGRDVPGATQWGRFEWGLADWSPVVNSDLLSGAAPEDEFGYEPHTWRVGRRQRFARFSFECLQPTAHLTLHWIDMMVRSSGRR